MPPMEIQTANLRLVAQTPEEALAMVESLSPADRAEVSPVWLARVRALTAADPWVLGFAVRLRTDDTAIGSCGFKGPPDQAGIAEIAYGIDPDFQGRGYATEAARALTNYAFGDSRVRLVCAHTFEKDNASTKVLTKCGFRDAGDVIDPEDGLVRRWEKPREATDGPGDNPVVQIL